VFGKSIQDFEMYNFQLVIKILKLLLNCSFSSVHFSNSVGDIGIAAATINRMPCEEKDSKEKGI
jgi:hypothetical protein